MSKPWVGPVVLAICIGATVALSVWLGPSLCEEDPSFCDDYQETTYVPLLPVFGLVGAVLVILGIVKMAAKMPAKVREAKKEGKA